MRENLPYALSDLDQTVKPTSSWKPNPAAKRFKDVAPGETLTFRILAWSMLLATAGYIFVFLRTPLADDQAWIMHIKGYLALVVMHWILAFLYSRAADFIDLGPTLKQIRAKVPQEDAVPVEIKLLQSGVTTGVDQGFLWVEDGTLYYKGRQTAFRINREDVPTPEKLPKNVLNKAKAGNLPKSVPLTVNGHDLNLKIKLVDPFEDYAVRRRSQQFQLDLAEWLLKATPSHTESLLPPTSVHPALDRKGWTRYEPLFGGGFLVTLNFILCFAVLYGYQMGYVQSSLNHIAAFTHLVLLGVSLHIAAKAWRTAKVRDSLVNAKAA